MEQAVSEKVLVENRVRLLLFSKEKQQRVEPEVIIRTAKLEDYPSFMKMEQKAWQGSDFDIISERMFNIWLEVFPEGLIVAEIDGKICGHIYGQICDFDPFDEEENEDLYVMTDDMYTWQTHNPQGNCLYLFSLSATYPSAGRKLMREYINLLNKTGKPYCSGAVRMPGLFKYAQAIGKTAPSKEEVNEYALLVHDTIKRKRKGKTKYFDPVLSAYLSIPGSDYSRVVENFFHDQQSLNWGCVIYYRNEFYHEN